MTVKEIFCLCTDKDYEIIAEVNS